MLAEGSTSNENTVRSHTVVQSTRKRVIGDKTFYKLGAMKKSENVTSSFAAKANETGKTGATGVGQWLNSSIEKMNNVPAHNQTWTSKFEPLVLNQTGPINYKASDSNMNDSVSKMNFSHAATKFINRRKNLESQMSITQSSFRDTQVSAYDVKDTENKLNTSSNRLAQNVKELRAAAGYKSSSAARHQS